MPDHRKENKVDVQARPTTPVKKADPKLEPPVRESSEQNSKDVKDPSLQPIGSSGEKGKPSLAWASQPEFDVSRCSHSIKMAKPTVRY
jgi:hypothetical protein